jgi:uncharacterized protein YjdB
MFNLHANLKPFRYWFLTLFITSNLFISGNSLVSGQESSDLSTGLSNAILEVAKLIIPPPEPVIITPTEVTLTIGNLNLYIGTSNRITATILPVNTTDKTITWSSSNVNIIEVTTGGIAVARNFGSATITASSILPDVKATINLTVIDYPDITDFEIAAFIFDEMTSEIEVGTSAKINLSDITPANGKRSGLSFVSSDPSIAVVNNDGVVRGLKAGSVNISATLGATTKILPMTVVDLIDVIDVTRIEITGDTLGYVGRPFSLGVDFGDVTPTDQQVTFLSSNTSIARVNDAGLVTPVNFANLSARKVTITVYANANPAITDAVELTIEKVFPVTFSLASVGEVMTGKTINITPTFQPSDVTDKQLIYTSSNESIATVSTAGDYGVVLGKKVGTVTITATSVMDNAITATTVVNITALPFLSPEQLAQFMTFVRKGIGHFSLNFLNGVLGFLTFFTMFPANKKRFLVYSAFTGAFLGAFAESLQFFAPGRSPTWDDVFYNVSGYLIAQVVMIIILYLVIALRRYVDHRRAHPKPKWYEDRWVTIK